MASQSQSTRLRAAQPGAQFIQLQMREPEMGKEAFVQGLSVRARAHQPRHDRRLTVAEDAQGLGSVQPFGQREIRTTAICCEGVFKRDNGVSRRALNVV
jgi:hypothetical protein